MPWFYGSSGGTGTSRVALAGSVTTSTALPATGTTGDAYIARDTGHLWLWQNDHFEDVGVIAGPAGPAPTITAGDVTLLLPGEPASVNLTQVTTGSYRLDLAIPAGGANEKQSYTHVQDTPSDTWTFIHDLPFAPAGMRIVDYDNPNTSWSVTYDYDPDSKRLTLTFPTSVRGEVTVS